MFAKKPDIQQVSVHDEARAIMEAMKEFNVTHVNIYGIEITMPEQTSTLLVQPDPRVDALVNEISLLKTAVQFKFNNGIK